jgi:hypothetical protein
LNYDLDPKIFICSSQRTSASKWDDPTGGAVLAAIVTFSFILLGLVLSIVWNLVFGRYAGEVLIRRG